MRIFTCLAAVVYFLRSKGLLNGLAAGTNWVFRDESMHMAFSFEVVKTVRQEEPAIFDDALAAYRGVMPFRPQDGRTQAGMAWALVGLKKPTADRIWSVAVGGDPAAVDKLGETLRTKGDGSGAKALWSKLAQSDPQYAQRAKLSEKLH